MASSGAGPSRRHHTKSRTGCKTCKKRHIRCDETLPQCRNCEKHQVRCDYMDAQTAEDQPGPSSVPDLIWTPDIERILEHWQRTGEASLGDFVIDLHAQGHTYTKQDLHLMYYALTVASNEFTVWTGKTAKFLATARFQPFLVHAILAFTALSIAWSKQSAEAKSLAYHHGGIAIRGLQEALGVFSRDNSDAILAASILLSWQANDWRSWQSLIAGTRTVLNSMQPWKNESSLQNIILEQDFATTLTFPALIQSPPAKASHAVYLGTLHQILTSLENLQSHLNGRVRESSYVEQLIDYIQRLVRVQPAQSPEEQFNHLYIFRKSFLFWTPAEILKSRSRDYLSLVVIAYFYVTALQLQDLFPDVAPAFCSTMVLPPLDEIFVAFDTLRQNPAAPNQNLQEMLFLLEYPKQVMVSYQSSTLGVSRQAAQVVQSDFGRVNSELLYSIEAFGRPPQPSPAFFVPPVMRRLSNEMSSTRGSPFLDVPRLSIEGSSTSGG